MEDLAERLVDRPRGAFRQPLPPSADRGDVEPVDANILPAALPSSRTSVA